MSYEQYRSDLERLLLAFPEHLRDDAVTALKVIPNANRSMTESGRLISLEKNITDAATEFILNGEKIIVPNRIYFHQPDPADEKNLTAMQQAIINCVYLRHNNGYIRQQRLEALFHNRPDFIYPFTFQLLGEQVIEILEVAEQHINSDNMKGYQQFTSENPRYVQTTTSRIISYWNCHYRKRFPLLKDYVGYRIIQKLKAADKKSDEPA